MSPCQYVSLVHHSCEENLQRRGMMGGGDLPLGSLHTIAITPKFGLDWIFLHFFYFYLFLYFVLETDLLLAYMLLQLYLRSNLDFPHLYFLWGTNLLVAHQPRFAYFAVGFCILRAKAYKKIKLLGSPIMFAIIFEGVKSKSALVGYFWYLLERGGNGGRRLGKLPVQSYL